MIKFNRNNNYYMVLEKNKMKIHTLDVAQFYGQYLPKESKRVTQMVLPRPLSLCRR